VADHLEDLGYPLSEVEAELRTYWSTPLEDEDDLLGGDLPETQQPDEDGPNTG
jgi:hypothetical protein